MFKSVEHMIIKWGKSTFVAGYERLQRRFIMCSLVLAALLIIFVPDRCCCSNPLALSQATRQ